MNDFLVVVYGFLAIVVIAGPYFLIAGAIMAVWGLIKRSLTSRPRHSPFMYYRKRR